jgi:ubiquinone/menaquinone biosynthesis C-methylase UbiE
MEEYDQFAKEYASGTEDLEQKTRLHFYSELPPLKGKLLLDVGCGSGHDGSYYASQGAVVYGMDVSEKEIAMAQERGCGIFVHASMESIPYGADMFDLVTSLYAIQHTDEVAQSILEMVRVAKPGGIIAILAKHPFRNLLESYVNDGASDYYAKRKVTSYIFNKSIKLIENGHTMMDYLAPSVLRSAALELLEEKTDFPASDQVISGLTYPTYMILKYRKLG